jgi:hypothetical protein
MLSEAINSPTGSNMNLFEFFAAIMPTGAFAFAARGPSAEFPTRIGERDTKIPAR